MYDQKLAGEIKHQIDNLIDQNEEGVIRRSILNVDNPAMSTHIKPERLHEAGVYFDKIKHSIRTIPPEGVLRFGPNGSHIIAIKPSLTYPNAEVVLAINRWNTINGKQEPSEWVTWMYNKQTNGYSWGHYIVVFQSAIEDFNARN